MNKTIILIALILIISVFANIAYSHDNHQSSSVTNVYNSQGVALAIATAQIHPEVGTSKWQFGAGLGSYGNTSAITVGIGKRVGKVLINGTLGTENGKTGLGVGVNFRF